MAVIKAKVPTTEKTRAAAAKAALDRRLKSAARSLYNQHETTLIDLAMLRTAIERDDPKSELVIRVSDIAAHTTKAMTKATA